MELCLLVVLGLAALCDAKPLGQSLISLGVTSDSAQNSSAWAMLSMQSSEVPYGANVAVTFQRVAKESPHTRAEDFLGLYLKSDPRVSNPWNWESVGPTNETGIIHIEANKAGEMEIRLVRPPNFVLAHLPLTVSAPCNPNCFHHGTCVKSACVCNDGYAGDSCQSVSGDGMKLRVSDLEEGADMQAGKPVKVLVSHRVTSLQANGFDYVGIYPADSKNGTAALLWKPIPKGVMNGTVVVEVGTIKSAGEYVARYTLWDKLIVMAQSAPFVVYEYCPHQCYGHGKCLQGKCYCDEGFKSPDCSIGPGIVTLRVIMPEGHTTLFQNEEVSVEFTRQFNPDYPLLLTDGDWIGMFGVGDVDADPFAYQYARADPELADGNTHKGVVEFIVPPNSPSAFVFRYVRYDHTIMTESTPAPVYLPCANPTCSGHGDCEEGVCVCEPEWGGDACDIGQVTCALHFNSENVLAGKNITVSFERGVGVGSKDDYIGAYLDTASTDNSQGLLAYVVSGGEVSKDAPHTVLGSVTIAVPVPGEFRLRLVNVFTKATICESERFTVYAACPNDCASHGVCYHGVCGCHEGWKLPDCKRAEGVVTVTVPKSLTLAAAVHHNVNLSVLVSRPEGWYNVGDMVGLFTKSGDGVEPMLVAYTPADPKPSSKEWQQVVSVPSAIKPGVYVVAYVNGPNKRIAESSPIEVLANCNEGTYDLKTLTCKCPDKKTGPKCEADTCCWDIAPSPTRGKPHDTINVTWSRPHKNGHNSDIIGLYLHNATTFDTPFAWQYADGGAGDTGHVTLELPGVEEVFTVHYVALADSQLDSKTQSKGQSPEVFVTIPCPAPDCSGNGVCLAGACTCVAGFGGAKCDKVVASELALELEHGGPFTPSQMISFAWSRPADAGEHGDYVGVFKRLEDSSRPFAYVFVPITSETFSGKLQIVAPAVKGVFQLRWVAPKTNAVLVTSKEFVVE